MSPVTAEAAAVPVSTEVYQDLQHFYARQMQSTDDLDVPAWAGSFTEDGVFATNAFAEPITGRAAIAAHCDRAFAAQAAAGIVRRHVMTMLAADSLTDAGAERVRTRSYVMVLETLRGRKTTIYCSTLCEDELVRADGGWQVLRRQVHRDDL
ncbi:nuclear transport factor 2 family protein [Streptomyces sp. NBC_01218]|uniref:nuclear transport factor 2 family protein n=1 Tax=unclassified Streptomyces TaxID=2593676 RepID=UPI0023B9F405|nr:MULTISPECIES: nuclear transport factor 2 family protein [unclassified Streptomyces]WEH40470.1 nuclear transport factor 2 family protein [Streptomyces sp. AM 2-1-1]WSQ52162.1 nuclear transport factor 2 family protein [Streptomyces sp. NBC_01218]